MIDFEGEMRKHLVGRIDSARNGLETASDERSVLGYQMAIKECRDLLKVLDRLVRDDLG